MFLKAERDVLEKDALEKDILKNLEKNAKKLSKNKNLGNKSSLWEQKFHSEQKSGERKSSSCLQGPRNLTSRSQFRLSSGTFSSIY